MVKKKKPSYWGLNKSAIYGTAIDASANKYDYSQSIRRIKKHAEKIIVPMVDDSEAQSGYEAAIRVYTDMKTRFLEQCFKQQSNAENIFNIELSKMFDQDNKDSFINTCNKLFQELFNTQIDVSNNSLTFGAILDRMYNIVSSKGIQVITTTKKAVKDKIKIKIKNSNGKLVHLAQSLTNAEKTQFTDEIYKLINTGLSARQGVYGSTVAFQLNDLINNVLIPAVNNFTIQKIGQLQNKQAIINYRAAYSFWFEAMFYQAFYQLLTNMEQMSLKDGVKITHTGAKNRQDDILIGTGTTMIDDLITQLDSLSKTSPVGQSTNDQNNLLNLEQEMYKVYKQLQQDFGIQVKNEAFFNELGSSTQFSIDTAAKFIRISNHADLLKSFRNIASEKLNKQLIPSEDMLNTQAYAVRIAEGMIYLSELHRIIKVMGELNVAYADKNGFYWTHILLAKMLARKSYLSFQSTVGATKTKLLPFGDAIGFQRFGFI